MALFDDYNFNTNIVTALDNVGNTSNTTNTATVGVDLDNVGNTDNSVNDSGNLGVVVDGSFQDGSHNTEIDMEDSGNEGSYNDVTHITDNSMNDDSINAGVREYNLGFAGDLHLGGGGGGGGGETWVTNHNVAVDQSVNQNILSGDGVFQAFSSESVLASGEGSVAVGDDFEMTQTLDRSTTIDAGGDVLIGSEKTVSTTEDSYNTTNVDVDIDNSVDVDLENVGNDYSATLDIDDSFNEETTDVSVDVWDVDADVIWDSEVAVIVDDIDV